MKKISIFLIFLFLIFSGSQAQNIFHENFEIPDSVVSSGPNGWGLYNQVQTSGFFSDSTSGAPNDSVMLTTISFSTLGLYHNLLKFNHICTFDAGYKFGIVYVSINNGISWIRLSKNEYLGNNFCFGSFDYFSSYCYGNWSQGIASCCPQNSQWHNEIFDISSICSNQANVMVQFRYINNSPVTFGSWFIDDVTIDGFPYSTSSTIDCNASGTATMTPYFGSVPYTYQWSTIPVQTTQTATGLTRGTYNCTVTDFGGTSFSDSVRVASAITLTSYILKPNCGMANGSISVNISTNNPPYNFLWSTGAITGNLQNLSPGIYTITVTDVVGCARSDSFDLSCGFNTLNLTITTTPSVCNTPTGTATVQSFNAATPPFTYLWGTSPIQTTQTAINLAPGNYYTVTVIDSLGDSATSGVVIYYNDTIIASATYIPTVCLGNTGTATANPTGGISPYTYQWNTVPIQTTQTATGLANICYTLIATDANGCIDDAWVCIPNNNSMTASISSGNTLCGQATGTAFAFVTNGTPPISYLWSTSPAQTTATATGLSQGSYHVNITDSNGCKISKYSYVNSNPGFAVNVSYSPPMCSCVAVTANVSGGGIPPYTYQWSSGQTTQTDTCLGQGWQLVQVTDSLGCDAYASFFINYSAACYIDIDGYVFADLNSNCLKDPGEYGIANVNLTLSGLNYSYNTLTDNNTGHYHFHVLNDVYQLSQSVPPLWNQLCPLAPAYYSINVPSGSTVNLDFADSADSYFDDVEIVNCYSSPDTRGFNTYYTIEGKNKGTTMVSGSISGKHDPNKFYLNSSPVAAYNIANYTATWNYFNAIPQQRIVRSLTALIPAATPLGTLMLDTAFITPLLTDVYTPDNYCNNNLTVTGSYDPNSKLTIPDGVVHPDSLWHFYTINFQNTGTGVAIRIIVTDTLDSNLDLTSITDVFASHNFITDTSDLPVVKFIFNNIFLPDSGYDETGSHGYVSFRIKHLPGLNNGTQLSNTANIYFDFNSPIITNTVTNIVDDNTSIAELSSNLYFEIYPNPVNDILTISYLVLPNENISIDVLNLMNQKMHQLSFEKQLPGLQQTKLSTKNLTPGIYIVRIKAGKKSGMKKLVKMN